MLVVPKPDAPLQQGDVIRDVPFVVIPTLFNVKANGVGGQERLHSQDIGSFQTVKTFAQGKAMTAASLPLVLTPGMILTQGCDIDYKDQITLARIVPIGHMLQNAREAIEHDEPLVLHDIVRRLTEGPDNPDLIYLGPLGDFGRCVADLMRVQSFTKPWKECFRQNRWMSCTEEGVKYMQGRLSSFTGRYALTQSFWHMEGDGQNAKLLLEQKGALEEARKRLEAKRGK